MNKKYSLITIVLFLLLLCACQQEPAPTDASLPTTAAASRPTQASTEPTPPWRTTEEEPLSYDAYFEKTRVYEGNVTSNPDWGTFPEPSYYCVNSDETGVFVANANQERVWEIGSAEDYAGCVWVAADPQCVYGISGGTELFRMDYYGENRETLFVDASGLLGELNELFYADHTVMFFMAGSDNGIGIYRLYLPTLDINLLYSGILQDSTLPFLRAPYSNHEVIWGDRNPEFIALYDELMAESVSLILADIQKRGLDTSEFPVESERFRRNFIAAYIHEELDIPSSSWYYWNAASEEYYELPVKQTNSVYHDGWWDGFQALNELSVTLPEGATPLSRLELDELNQQLFDPGEDRSNPGCLFLASYYDAPEDVDLFVLFCGGLGLDCMPSEAEWDHLEALGFNRNLDYFRTTPEQIEQTLLTYTGLTLDETNQVGLEQMRYVEELGAYYTKSPGTYWSSYTMLGGYRTQTGERVLYYEDALQKPAKQGIVTLRVNENGSGYWFVSNQPFEE